MEVFWYYLLACMMSAGRTHILSQLIHFQTLLLKHVFAYGHTCSTIPSTIFFIDYRDIQGHIDNLVVK